MSAVLTSIQPYYVFLIIARLMGWDIPQEKTVEARKDFPKDTAWNKRVHIYCSKNKKSFNRIPKQYQPLMGKLLGKVIGEFVCDRIETITIPSIDLDRQCGQSCLSVSEMLDYIQTPNTRRYDDKPLYGWHISDLKIYDKPRELGEFKKLGYMTEEQWLYALYPNTHCHYEAWAKQFEITRPPQSWCYVDVLGWDILKKASKAYAKRGEI